MNQFPNILMIMTDQHHADCLGFRGHPDVRTPVLDRLASEGVRFDQAFTCHGTCVPSRVSYLTSMYPHQHGVYAGEPGHIPASLLSLPTHLKNYGFRTAIIGKKHLPNWPTHGFDYERLCYTADAATRQLDYYNYLKKHDLHQWYDYLGDVEKFTLGEEQVPMEHCLENWTADETLAYLKQQDDKPFFTMVSFERPHPPLTVPPDCPFLYDPASLTLPENQDEVQSSFFFDRNVELKWCKSYHGEEALRLALSKYYALISLIDFNIGRIMQGLEQYGLRDNTIIIFCSDHGDFAGEYSRMAKGFPYDALHRVPFVWNWPGHFASGKVEEGFAQTVDFMPTVCNLLNLPTPRSAQGASLVSALTDPTATTSAEEVFFESALVKTVRTKTHKLNYAFDRDGEKGELYDLNADPHEYNNLYHDPAYAEERDELLRKLLNWWIRTQQPVNFSQNDELFERTRWF